MGVSADAFRDELETLVENSIKGATRINPVSVIPEDMHLILTNVFDGKLPV